MNHRRTVIVNFGAAALTIPLFVSAFNKLTLQPSMVETMRTMGYDTIIRTIGCLELITAICFAIPLTRALGFFFINIYLGGAIAAELASDPSQVIVPLFMIITAWVLMLYDDAKWLLRGLLK
ncbi:hypothetical protein COTS27_00209 [Spirochaetota bacterium]|nr:hypothetical protein COTS27_00209 [Spirochaetota bacterium]